MNHKLNIYELTVIIAVLRKKNLIPIPTFLNQMEIEDFVIGIVKSKELLNL